MSWKDNAISRLTFTNPIFVRVVETAAKRSRHALIRILYLGLLVGVALIMVLVNLAGGGTLTELSLKSAQLFTVISFVQLGMACLLAPVFTAGAITQEKDNQTYNLLLATPLSNAQIVLGSLVSRLFFVLVLLASGIPIFLITQLFGGVTGRSILLSFMIAAATAVFTGAMAVAIAVIRVGTGKTIFSFYVVAGLYLAGVWFLAGIGALAAPGGQTSWLTALHPFLSLMVVLNISHPPGLESLPQAGWLVRLWVCHPHYAYLCWTLGSSVVMVALGTIFLRYTSSRTTAGWSKRIRLWLTGGRETRKPRSVWSNPVAWREAATRASSGGKSGMRWLFLIGGLAGGLVLLIAYSAGSITDAAARSALQSVLWVELTVVLLVLCNVSASSITREREGGTLDLLLVTPITSRYYVWGKLRGLLSFAAVLLAVPVGTAAMFAVYGLLASPAAVRIGRLGRFVSVPIMPPEAVLELAVCMLTFCALTVMIALGMSLKVRRTISAVIGAVAVVGVLAFGAGACGMAGVNTIPVIGPLLAMFSPYVVVALVTSPHTVADDVFARSGPLAFRIAILIHSLLAAGAYSLIVWTSYKSMVKTFDMIVRKQSR